MTEAPNRLPEKKKTKRKKPVLRRLLTMLILLVVIWAAGYHAYSSLKQEYTVSYTGYTASIGSISNALSFSGSLNLIKLRRCSDGAVRVGGSHAKADLTAAMAEALDVSPCAIAVPDIDTMDGLLHLFNQPIHPGVGFIIDSVQMLPELTCHD